MRKKILLLGFLLSFFASLQSQTTLSAGDIAIIGVNYDTSPNYELTIVTLVPIAANTQIYISDYWYNESTPNKLTNVQASTGNALTSEGAILWTTNVAIPAGTVYKISIAQGGNTVSGLPGTVSVTGWSTPTGTPSSQGGDNWFIYQGSSVTDVSTFIFLWGNGSPRTINTFTVTPGEFVPSGSGNLSSNGVTYLPPSLTLGTNAIALTVDPAINSGVGFHADNNVYIGTESDTKASILAAICNKNNWTRSETTTYDISPSGTNFSGTNPIFTITGLNTAPTDIALSTNAINENVAANSTVGTLSSTDANSGNTFTYTLVAGTGDTDNAAFSISGSDLKITASPDFETKSSYAVRIRTTDQGGLTFEKAFTITINDINEAPTDISLSAAAINENVAANSTVGSLSSTDADSGNTFTYSLVAGTGSTDNASFNISGSNLRITTSPDFETKSSYSIRIRTTDQGGLFFEKAFTITINNVNEAPTDIALTTSAINENVAANSTVGSFSSTDVDSGNTFTYTLVAGTGSTDNASFNISGSNLRITASPDFETKSSYAVRIRTTDQGGLFFEKTFTITINDVNETPTDIALSAAAIDENVAANSTVGTLSSTDADSGNTFTYTLVAGTGSTDNASFNISGSNLRITASPDFETKSSYSIRIRTTDQGSLTFEKAFTITINDLSDINQAPTDITLSAAAIDENVAANSTVGALSTTDVDTSSFTYALVAGAGDTDNAAFSISGSDLKITASPDFETKASYSVRVSTFDGTSTFEKAFTISINDINEAPTDIALSAAAIDENVAANSTVGTLSTTDVDTSSFTYALVAGAGDTDNAAFSISGSDLKITASPDFETKASYSVRIRTFDGTSTFEKAFTISINDLNESPTDIALSATAIDENVAANSTVGTLSSTDVDTSSFTYALVAGTGDTDNAAFTISGSDLKITASPDFETKSSYSVRVSTFDGTSTFEKAFTISINDLNEAPTDITLSAAAIDENVTANSTVGTLSSTDLDTSSFTYALVAGTGDTDNAAFSISGSDLKITASPDFETKASYSVRVSTFDGTSTFEKAFTISINDINEAPTDIALSAAAIDENIAANSTVGTLSSTDVDTSSFTYALVAGTGDTDNAAFSISGSDLKITASPDFETKSSYSVRVRTFDGTSTFEKAFTISINDLNEAPTDIALSASAIDENVAANSTVGALSTTDVDTSSFTYALVAGTGDTDNTAFSISGSDLKITASPDFESKSSYSVRVRTFDGTSTFEKAFTISINDINEAPTDITLSAAAIDENVAANSTVGTLSSTDLDTSSFTYALVAGTGDTDNAAFSISGSDLKITASPDFETKSSYSVRIRTFDGTSTFEKAFTISINDLNESPTDIALSATAIDENVAANSTVGTLSSTDVDTSSFTYALVAGTGDTDNAAFTISGSDLKITASPDFETKSSYSVRVSTFDGTSTFEKAFTISINDINEAPTDITLSAAAIDENVTANSTVGTLSSTDLDTSSFTYALVAGTGDTDNAAFSISGSDLKITASPDFETKSSYSVRVRTFDGTSTFEKAFTISINDLNEAPTDIALSASAIDENVAANSTVGALSTTDVDTSSFTYALVAGTGDTDNTAFSISGSDLKITASPDFETKFSYSVRIRTFDGTSTFEKAFTISINDLNESPTDIALSAAAIDENVAANSTVGTLSSTDLDTSSFTYSLVSGTGDTDNAAFSISGSDLKITASPDFETKSSYSVRIRTFDGTSTFEKAFTISINDLNEAPTDIALSAAAIDENVAANSTVGTLSTTDVDTSSFTYALVAGAGDTDNAAFSISGSDLKITASPDFETKASYSVRVSTFDGTSTFEKAFTISINDINEAPTDIALSAAAIDENIAANSTVGTLSSTDVDTSSFTYSLVAGAGDTDNAAFTISGSDLKITASPDFETKASYSVRVSTFDGTSTFEKAFTISINDLNESPTDIALSATAIDENVAANSTVGTLSSTDVDTSSFTYALVAGTGDTDNAAFTISGSDLKITASPDFETKSSYSVRVSTFDGTSTFEKAFTISINDLNEAPTDITLSAAAIDENVTANSTVGTLSSTDLDTSSFTYALVAGTGDTDNAAFSISGSDLKITASPDFETKASYSVRVSTFDGTSTFEKAFTISINDINEAPTDIALSAAAIDENIAANSTVGTLSSTDVDTSSFTYALVAGTGDTDNAAFSISGSDLKITASPDFETKSSYSVRVRTFDGTSTFEKAFTISINDLNEAPTDIALSASAIDENVAANSTVGALSTTDVDTSSFTYALVAGTGDTDNTAFSISGSDLKITASPDFESKSSYSVRVRTFDGTSTFEKAFTISINDINEAPTDITLSAAAIDENVAANSTVGTLSSTDLDTSSFTYALVAGTGDTDNAAFSISGSDLKITASPDFETKSSYSVRIRTFDGTSTFEKAFTISINDLNEAPTDITLSAAAIDENVTANSTVGTLSSTDLDTSSFTYALVAGTGDTDNAAFSISGSDLKITASPDFETKASYSVRVSTFDGTSTFEKAFTISINDINEAPTDIALSAAAIDENIAANSTVGTLSSTDVDTSSFTYALVAGTGDTDNAAFSISGSDLKITASPDFETKSSYSVRVRTFDGTSTFEKAFTISINDLNEAPTDIALSASAIDENVAANSTVGALSTTDVDTSSFTYALVAGTGDTDNTAFSISGSDLKITASPDFESKSSYSVRVRTFDGTSTFEKAFTISINDINEAPTDITLSAAAIDENVTANSTVGTLSSTDLDTSSFTYALVAGTGDTDNAAFSISGSDLKITASPDFETKASYSVRVSTFDGTSTFEKAFTISINDINEAPTDIALSAAAIDENIAANSTVGTLSSTDVDTSSFTYALVAGTGDTDNAAFSISGSDLKITASPDFETKSSYSVRVRTFDGTSTFEKAFTISINDLNEAPTDIALSASAIDENVAANSTVGALSTTDVDTSSFTYALVAGTGDTDNTAFSISGSDLKITASPDFESKSSYSVRVRTFDGTSTFEKAFTISINDINEAPTDITLSALVINERVATNSTVGAFTSTDFDSGNTFTYSLVNGLGDVDNASFSISGATLLIATSPDFETKASYSIRVKATDQNGLFFEKQFTITINDVCELDGSPTLANDTLNPTQTNVSCNGGTNGSASVTPPADASGYTYSWSPSGGTAATATGLAAGSYTVTITGANSCTTTRTFTITEPTAINFTTTVLSGYDYNTGYSQTIVASGGTGPKTYAVTAGSLPSGFSLSSAGQITGISTQIGDSNFTVTATDANNCTANYNYVLKLNQIPITVTATPSQTKVYGESDPVLTYTVSPSLLPGDSFTGSLIRVNGEDIGNYTINQGTLSAGSKYLITYAGTNFTITAKPITVTATPSQTKVYGTTDPIFDYTVSPSLVGSDAFTGALTRVTGENIGTYTINQGSLSAGSNYTISYADTNFTITAKPITVTATPSQTKVYGTTDPTFTYTVSPNLVGSDAFTGALTRVAGENIGNYAITQGNLSAGSNYTISYISKDFVITAKPITVTADPSQTKEYGTANPVYSYTVSPSLVSGDSFTGTLTRTSGENIGNYAITQGSLSVGSNYTITYVSKDFTITAKPITVTAAASQTKVYGTTDPVFAYTVSPSLVSGDSFTGALTRVAGENIGTYAITQGSLSAGSNYTITYVSKDFTITAKPITVTANASQTKVYGATDPIFDYTVSPSLVGSDAFTGALTRVTGENIGTYTINQGSLSAGSNYAISYADANFTITAKPITVTATPSQTKVYGTTDSAFTYTVSPNLVGSDAFTGALTRVAGENIGNYAITQGNLSAGSNYTITYVSKDFVITAKPITVTVDPSQTKVYGTANPVYSYTVSPSLVSGDSFTGTLTRTSGENIGNYAITQGSLSAGSNYTITYVSKDFTITAKPITVTADALQTKVYGTTDPVFAYTVSPSLVSGDSFTGTLTRAAGENVGVYAITQGSLSAGGNYTIMYNGSNFTITKADQVITWNQTLGLGCDGATSLVMTAVANSGLAVNYTSSNATIANVSNNSLLFQNYGSATITASQPGNMNYNAAPTVVLPVVTSQPNLIRKQFEDIIFFDNSSKSFKSYSWYKNGVLVPGQTSQYFKESGALNGTYYAVATKLDGTLITTCPLTLSPTVEEEYIRIVPNPVRSNANFQLITNVSSSKLQNARVELYNLTGSLLTTITNPNQNTIDMIAPNAGGIYIVKMTLANGKYFTKNLLVRN